MRLTLDEVTQISRAVAQEYEGVIELDGLTATDGGIDHVELLVTIRDCHDEPCAVMLSLTREDRTTMEQELRSQLSAALEAQVH